jgi:hypothetical protein
MGCQVIEITFGQLTDRQAMRGEAQSQQLCGLASEGGHHSFIGIAMSRITVPYLDSCAVRVLSPSPVRARMRRQPGPSDSVLAILSSRHP